MQLSTECIVYYIILNAMIMLVMKLYLADSVKPHPILICIIAGAGYMTIKTFPETDGMDTMMGMAGYMIFAGFPICMLGVVSTKLFADFIIGSGDFDADSKSGFLSDVKIPLDNFLTAGQFPEAIDFLNEKFRKGRYKNDYRINLEIAAIAMSSIHDFDLALKQYQQILKLTKKTEAVAYALYRIADIYSITPKTREEARATLKELFTKYPTTEFGKSADLRLKVMSHEDAMARSIMEAPVVPKKEEPPIEQLFFSEERGMDDNNPVADDSPGGGDDYQQLLKRSIDRNKSIDKLKTSSPKRGASGVSSLSSPRSETFKRTSRPVPKYDGASVRIDPISKIRKDGG